MSKELFIYPAIYTYEGGQISVKWPDLPGCVACGNTEEEAWDNAHAAMKAHLVVMLNDGNQGPEPSTLESLKLGPNERCVLIFALIPNMEKAKAEVKAIKAKKAKMRRLYILVFALWALTGIITLAMPENNIRIQYGTAWAVLLYYLWQDVWRYR